MGAHIAAQPHVLHSCVTAGVNSSRSLPAHPKHYVILTSAAWWQGCGKAGVCGPAQSSHVCTQAQAQAQQLHVAACI